MTRTQPGQCGCVRFAIAPASRLAHDRPERLDNPYELTASFPALAVSATS